MTQAVFPDPPAPADGPDLAAFRDAMSRLRRNLGTDATFHLPIAPTYDPAEPIDPETGRPYDPFATPAVAGGETDVIVRVTVTENLPIPRRDDLQQTPIGRFASDMIGLDLDADDYPSVQHATAVTVHDQRFKVEDFRPSGLNGVDRYIAYIRSA